MYGVINEKINSFCNCIDRLSDYRKIRPVGINSTQDVGVTTHIYSFDVRGNNLSTVARLGYKF